MLKRIILALLIGLICGAIIGAVGFALSGLVFGRGIGILNNSLSLVALTGAVYLGACGGVMGVIIGVVNLNIYRSLVVGLACGGLLVIRDLWISESRYFYESGYFDRQMIFSDVIHWITMVLGLTLASLAVSILQSRVFGGGR